jgi:glycosyltransferase involved in cell wall biosynthesis
MAGPFPKLLVATEFSPNSAGGSGAVLRQMLKDWPAENLFWWSCLPDRDEHFGRKVAAHRVALIPHKLYPNRRAHAQKSWLLEKFWVPWAARHLRRTLEMFRPEVVWVLPHGWSIPPLARVLPQAGIGFHVSIHDYADAFGTTQRSSSQMAMQEKLYASAHTRDAICRPMVDDLRARTGCAGTVARAGLEPEDLDFLSRKTEVRDDAIRIAYAGTIIVEKEFALFARTLAQIRRQLPLPLTIEFFGDHSYRSREWFDPSWMNEHGHLPASELSAELKKCSWGFSPMGLTDDKPRYNRFSLPTKFVSYLAAGLPVITLGHPESSLAKLAREYHVGPCITSGEPEVLSRELSGALSGKNPWSKYGPEVLRCARDEFDMQRMRAVLHGCFEKCAAATGS